MRFLVLGPVRVESTETGGRIDLRPGMVQRLLAVLLSRSGGLVTVDELVEAFWPIDVPVNATKAVQVYVHRLRRLLGEPDRVLRRCGGYTLALRPGELDAEEFAGRLREARAAGSAAARLERFDHALRMWRGPPFADVECAALEPEVEHLVELRLQAQEERAEILLELGRAADLVTELPDLVAEHPFREHLATLLMTALYRTGRQADALDVFARTRKVLAEELGIDPGTELARTHQAILRGESADARRSPDPPAQLPADVGSLTGRDAELGSLLSLASETNGTVVVSSIDGMAGIGKTALAVHASHLLKDRYPDGQVFVDLRGFTPGIEPAEPGAVLYRLLHGLGLTADRIPADIDDRAALWRSALSDRRLLVLLDNAANEAQVRPLLPASPGCLVLVTSRRRLSGLDDARPVSLGTLERADAVALLRSIVGTERADGASAHDLAQVVELCGRLPLAIRLVGARLRDRPAWSVHDLLARLRDEPRRLDTLEVGQRSVAEAFALSYGNLDAEERRLFRLLGLHPGTSLDAYAIAALAGVDLRRAEHLAEHLVDVHLVDSRRCGRYGLHDLLRAYAATVVVEEEPDDERTAAVRRILDHYRWTVARAMDVYAPAERHLRPDVRPARTPGPAFESREDAVAWLDAERTNLVDVVAFAADRGWTEHAAQIARCLARYFALSRHDSEALELYEHALRAVQKADDPQDEAWILQELGIACKLVGRRAEACTYFERALTLFREQGDPEREAAVLWNLAQILHVLGRLDEAWELGVRVIELHRRHGDARDRCRAAGGAALTALRLGRLDEALRLARQALGQARRSGTPFYEGLSLETLGAVHLRRGDPARALARARRSRSIMREIGARAGEYQADNVVGEALCAAGDPDGALEHHRMALAIAYDIGDPNAELETQICIGRALYVKDRPADAVEPLARAVALARGLDQRYEEAQALALLGDVHCSLGSPVRARESWQWAYEISFELGIPDASAIAERLGADRVERSAGGLYIAPHRPVV